MNENATIHLAIPKGRMQDGIARLLADAGINMHVDPRGYRPVLSDPGFEVKLLKPQSIVEMLAAGSRDLGFTGADWVAEKQADVVELLDTELDQVQVIAAAPTNLLADARTVSENRPWAGGFRRQMSELPGRPLVVASEYERLARAWIADNDVEASFVRSYGATEVLPPEDADVIIDNSATGATLAANNLVIIDELLASSTRLYASRAACADPAKKRRIDDFVLSITSVLEARKRAMLELNVQLDDLETMIAALPSMREPTISTLHGGKAMALKAAVPRADLPRLIPRLKELGATDIVVSTLDQIVP